VRAPKPLRWALDELRARRLEHRGDLLRGTAQFWDFIVPLAEDPISGPKREISRDLFVMLAGVWAIQAKKRVSHDPYGILRHVHDRAWLGYTDTQALAGAIGRRYLARGVSPGVCWGTAI
jgi:hypothetical protein